MNRILVGLAACTFCSLAVAGNVFAKDGIAPAYPPKPTLDMHAHNRAVAFGSVILANGGSDVTTWKKVEAHRSCMHLIPGTSTTTSSTTGTAIATASITSTSIGTSIDTATDGSDDTTVPDIGLEPGDGGGSTQPFPIGPGRCSYTVMMTTHYELVECPDGRAYVTRSGEGVDVESATEGQTFAWGEAVICGPDAGPFDRLDKDRPLDMKNITKTMK